jgi:hypothetical protein
LPGCSRISIPNPGNLIAIPTMFAIPNMIMIGGNSRNSGKTTMACSLITKLSVSIEVIGLKVTTARPGEDEMHGNHTEKESPDYSIFEELNSGSEKDTSKMLRAGATHVYYIQAKEYFLEKTILHFMSRYINNQIIVCESRSLRRTIKPGLFLMMLRLPAEGKTKEDLSSYIELADKVFHFGADESEKKQFVDNMRFTNGKFDTNV